MLTSIGIAPSIARFTARHLGRGEKHKLSELYSSTLFYYVLAATVLGAVVFFGSNWIAYSFFKVPELALIIKITAFGIPFGVFVSVYTGFFQGFKKMDRMSYTIIAHQVFRVVVSALLVWLGYRVVGAILGSSIAFAFGVFVGYFLFRKLDIHYTKANFKTFKEVFKFSVPTSISGLATVIFVFTDIFLIGKLMSTTAVGIYSAASPTARLTIAIAVAISATILPIVAEKRAKNNEEKIKHHTYQSLLYYLLAAIPLMVGLYFIAPWMLSTLFGQAYLAGTTAFRILIVGSFFISIHIVLAGSFQGIGWPSIPMYVIMLAAIVNLILNLKLIPLYGIEGAALATSISSGIAGVAALGIFMAIRNKT
jgi:stage V sporulation protein B